MAKAQEVKEVAMTALTQAIENEKKEQWRVDARSMLFDAKRVRHFFFLHFTDVQQQNWHMLISSK